MTDDDHDFLAAFAQQFQTVVNEPGADSLALMIGMNRDRREGYGGYESGWVLIPIRLNRQ